MVILLLTQLRQRPSWLQFQKCIAVQEDEAEERRVALKSTGRRPSEDPAHSKLPTVDHRSGSSMVVLALVFGFP